MRFIFLGSIANQIQLKRLSTKNTMMKLAMILALLFGLLAIRLPAQRSKVEFTIQPIWATIIIDRKDTVPMGQWMELPSGFHHIRLVANHYEQKDTSLVLQDGAVQKIKLLMESEGVDLRRAINAPNYRINKSLSSISLFVLPLDVGIGVFAQVRSQKHLKPMIAMADSLRNLMSMSIDEDDLGVYRSQFDDVYDKYKPLHRNMVLRNVGVAVTSLALASIIIRNRTKMNKLRTPHNLRIRPNRSEKVQFGQGNICPMSLSFKLLF
jgi:hypothetical protein